ncbi:carboxypeptidase-like regulatory domain-containing protein [Spirosoma montaniterrae]|uniref:Secretin/TonB short N-terminal domain-containing protein n=1 Tax=Spirosoma montaniterrae TaxID=1178516 RepID=A0A1P9WRR6_9BACT|nr:carboxypeptidase-like regulatory domain-containing protein [Spirosoma montaniterrae]AQG78061.1 hypothetical protein AWR27_01060 [Spirosoma montaniterrae]
MHKLLRIPFVLTTGCLLSVPPLHAQLLARQSVARQQVVAQPETGTLRLRDAIMQLKKQYGVDIIFEERLLDGISIRADLLTSGGNVERTLTNLLRSTKLSYKRVRRDAFVILSQKSEQKTEQKTSYQEPAQPPRPAPVGTPASVASLTPNALVLGRPEDRTVSGLVTSETGEGLPGVSVVAKGSSRGTTTDGQGRYRLNVPDEATTLVFSFVGYLSQEVVIGNRSAVDVGLKPDDKMLSEVVVVGYGTQKKTDLTGAIGSVNAKVLAERPTVDILGALSGQVPGLNVHNGSGRPGAAFGSTFADLVRSTHRTPRCM